MRFLCVCYILNPFIVQYLVLAARQHVLRADLLAGLSPLKLLTGLLQQTIKAAK